MSLRYRMAAFSAVVMGVLVVAGCGAASNEEDIAKAGSATPTGSAPQYKSYSEFAKAQMEQNKAKAEEKKAGKAAGGTHK